MVNSLTISKTEKVACFSYSGFKPDATFSNSCSALKKCGSVPTSGIPNEMKGKRYEKHLIR